MEMRLYVLLSFGKTFFDDTFTDDKIFFIYQKKSLDLFLKSIQYMPSKK